MTGAQFPQDLDGVQASFDAGTPFALEGGRAADALEALEFAQVLQLIAEYAAGPEGSARVRSRWPSDDVAMIREELARVTEAAELERDGRGLVAELVPDVTSALARLRVAGSVLEGHELADLRALLAAARLVSAELRRVATEAPKVFALARPVPDRAVERRLELAVDADGRLLDSASPALAGARSEVRAARARLVQRLESLLRGLGSTDGGVTIRNGRYVIPVPRDARGRPDGIIHDESASGLTLFLEPSATIDLGNALRSAEVREEREVLKVYRDLTDLLRPEHATLLGAREMGIAVDDLVARARYASKHDAYAPDVAPAPAALRISNGRHPLLLARADAQDTREPVRVVPFDLELASSERTVLLSGPNTGGKSVLLKAVGLSAALAQSGIIPPIGKGSALPVFRRYFADIGDRQSISASLSTFSAHVAVLRKILDESDDASLVLLDEIGSGTDPAEGGALASAALQSLTDRGSITLATTHLGSLKQLATRSAGVVNASLQFDAATLRPTYRLLKGVPGRSYGLAIARRLGVSPAVLAEAEAQVPEAERSLDALLAAVEQRERDQSEREQLLTGRLLDAESLQANLASQAESQSVREADLRRRERDAERAARAQAKTYLLEARQRVEEALGKARGAVDEAAAKEARRLVEDGVKAESAALSAAESSEADEELGSGESIVSVGDRVRGPGGVGQVVEIRGDGKLVVAVGAMKLVIPADAAVVLPPAQAKSSSASFSGSHEPASESAPMEVDLRGLTGDEAEQAVFAAIDSAVLAENPFLRIIHGKGTGVVRERVRRVVTQDRRITKSGFAPSNQGGTGVTIVEFTG
ncbi:MAG: Smr/MutS family protein [Gemmatimonadota bacterium]